MDSHLGRTNGNTASFEYREIIAPKILIIIFSIIFFLFSFFFFPFFFPFFCMLFTYHFCTFVKVANLEDIEFVRLSGQERQIFHRIDNVKTFDVYREIFERKYQQFVIRNRSFVDSVHCFLLRNITCFSNNNVFSKNIPLHIREFNF